jgi:hypothetical protein
VDTDSPSLLELLPALLSLTLTTTISAFFLGYAWHVPDPTPSLPVPPAALDETAPGHFAAERAVSYGIISRIVTTILLLGPVLFAVRRWRLPFGTVTILFTTVTGFMYLLLSDRTPPLLALTTVVAGLAADLLLRWLDVSADRPITVYVFGALVPIVLWSLNMAAIWMTAGMGWTPELWSGTILITGLVGVGLSLIAVPPRARAGLLPDGWDPNVGAR